MGLLDEAIREHLELKRRRGADAGELSRAESEALGPVRRAPDGTPDLASLPDAPPQAQAAEQPYPGEHPPGFDVEPDWSEETAVMPAQLAADDPDATVAFRPPPPPPAPPTSTSNRPPAFRNDPAPRPDTFEPLVPRSAAPPPPAPALPSYEPPSASPYESPPPESPEPAPAKSRFGAASRLRLRRGGAADEPPAPAPREPVEPFFDEPAAPPPAAHEPPRPAYEPPPPAYEPPATRAHQAPPPPAYPPPPPYQPPPPPPRDRGDEPAGEDLLEETPEFLEETPDHDRLWFEQRPPRDFDFDK